MTTKMTKVFFDGNKMVAEEIPEAKIYWQDLTQEEINKAWDWAQKDSRFGVTRIESFANEIQRKLKEKNNAF